MSLHVGIHNSGDIIFLIGLVCLAVFFYYIWADDWTPEKGPDMLML